jgi:hypothetical protein
MTTVMASNKEASLRGDPSTSLRMTEGPDKKSSNRRGASHLLFLTWVQGLAPAQGSVKPTVGFTFNHVIRIPSFAV